jgi:hypothetical protein
MHLNLHSSLLSFLSLKNLLLHNCWQLQILQWIEKFRLTLVFLYFCRLHRMMDWPWIAYLFQCFGPYSFLDCCFCRDGHECCCWCYFVIVGIDFAIAMLLFVNFSVTLVFFCCAVGFIVGSHCSSSQKRWTSGLEMVGKDFDRNKFFT